MWLRWTEEDGSLQLLNLNTVASIFLQKEQKTIAFFGVAHDGIQQANTDEDARPLIEVIEFATVEKANEVFEDIAGGIKPGQVLEIKVYE